MHVEVESGFGKWVGGVRGKLYKHENIEAQSINSNQSA